MQAWTGASSIPVALVHMLLRLPNLKFVIVTRGEKGCLMLERSMTGEYIVVLRVNFSEAFHRKQTPRMCILLTKDLMVIPFHIKETYNRQLNSQMLLRLRKVM